MSDAGVTSSSTSHVLSALVAGGNPASVTEGAEGTSEEDLALARIGEADVAKELAAIAGTSKTLCFWAGESVDEADYLWSFFGEDLPSDANFDVDLTVSDASDDERLASVLEDAKACAFSFVHEGAFPSPAMFGYRVDRIFANDDRVALYFFDEKADSLVLVQQGVQVADGYATAKIDHGGIWVLAESEDLAGSLSGSADKASSSSESETLDELISSEGAQRNDIMVGVVAAVIAGVAVVAAVVFVLVRRARAAKVTQDDSSALTNEARKEKGDQS